MTLSLGARDVASRSQDDRCALVRCFSTTLISFLVETKVFSGSSEKQREACVTLSAPPVELKVVKEFLPDGHSSPSNSCQSSSLSEPAESQQQSFLKPSLLLPGFLGPLQDVCTSPQEDNGAQIERKSPRGKEQGR